MRKVEEPLILNNVPNYVWEYITISNRVLFIHCLEFAPDMNALLEPAKEGATCIE